MKRGTIAFGLVLLTACYLAQFTVATATRKVASHASPNQRVRNSFTITTLTAI